MFVSSGGSAAGAPESARRRIRAALFSCGPSAAASRRSLQTHLHSERTNKRHHHHLCGVFDHICAEARPVPLSAWSSTAPVLPETFICCHMESFICGRIGIVRRLRPHLCRDIGPGCFFTWGVGRGISGAQGVISVASVLPPSLAAISALCSVFDSTCAVFFS